MIGTSKRTGDCLFESLTAMRSVDETDSNSFNELWSSAYGKLFAGYESAGKVSELGADVVDGLVTEILDDYQKDQDMSKLDAKLEQTGISFMISDDLHQTLEDMHTAVKDINQDDVEMIDNPRKPKAEPSEGSLKEDSDEFKVDQILNVDWDGPSTVKITHIDSDGSIVIRRVIRSPEPVWIEKDGEEDTHVVSPEELRSMLTDQEQKEAKQPDLTKPVKDQIKDLLEQEKLRILDTKPAELKPEAVSKKASDLIVGKELKAAGKLDLNQKAPKNTKLTEAYKSKKLSEFLSKHNIDSGYIESLVKSSNVPLGTIDDTYVKVGIKEGDDPSWHYWRVEPTSDGYARSITDKEIWSSPLAILVATSPKKVRGGTTSGLLAVLSSGKLLSKDDKLIGAVSDTPIKSKLVELADEVLIVDTRVGRKYGRYGYNSVNTIQRSRSDNRSGAEALMDPKEISARNRKRYDSIIATKELPAEVKDLAKELKVSVENYMNKIVELPLVTGDGSSRLARVNKTDTNYGESPSRVFYTVREAWDSMENLVRKQLELQRLESNPDIAKDDWKFEDRKSDVLHYTEEVKNAINIINSASVETNKLNPRESVRKVTNERRLVKSIAESEGLKNVRKFCSNKSVKESDDDTRQVIARGITNKDVADRIAQDRKGSVVADETDEKKFMVLAKSN